jgi:glycerol uptake facilitator-like aquaporin
LATGAGLVVLIAMFGPISGAHFNPTVTLVMAMRRAIGRSDAALYAVVQIVAAVLGVWLAHAMFGEAILQVSAKLRSEPGMMLGELVATFGVVGLILSLERSKPDAIPWGVGLFITSAYWFTSSTSFANPAVTLARSASDTFAGIRPADAPAFIVAQLLGASAATALFRWLTPPPIRAVSVVAPASVDRRPV